MKKRKAGVWKLESGKEEGFKEAPGALELCCGGRAFSTYVCLLFYKRTFLFNYNLYIQLNY